MLVVDGNWKKQLGASPASFLARVCGKSIIHLDSLELNSASDFPGTDPNLLNVAHFWPLREHERCKTLKVFLSESCQAKHKTFFTQLSMLSALHESNRVPISHRFKFELLSGDVGGMLKHLEKASCPQAAKNYRWLVTKDERDECQIAAGAVLNTSPCKVKIIMNVPKFIRNLGRRNVDTDQGRRHA